MFYVQHLFHLSARFVSSSFLIDNWPFFALIFTLFRSISFTTYSIALALAKNADAQGGLWQRSIQNK